tara:strand:- start:466 stop:1140 length:675 start_codon:yes stop_codon:yes gene_type:complete
MNSFPAFTPDDYTTLRRKISDLESIQKKMMKTICKGRKLFKLKEALHEHGMSVNEGVHAINTYAGEKSEEESYADDGSSSSSEEEAETGDDDYASDSELSEEIITRSPSATPPPPSPTAESSKGSPTAEQLMDECKAEVKAEYHSDGDGFTKVQDAPRLSQPMRRATEDMGRSLRRRESASTTSSLSFGDLSVGQQLKSIASGAHPPCSGCRLVVCDCVDVRSP